MKLNLALVVSIILAVGIVSYLFTLYQSGKERAGLSRELSLRADQTASAITLQYLDRIERSDANHSQLLLDSVKNFFRLEGLIIYYHSNLYLSADSSAKRFLPGSEDYISLALAGDTSVNDYFTQQKHSFFQHISPVKQGAGTHACIVAYYDASYIDNIISSIWFRNFIRWFLQALAVSTVTVLIIRWGIFTPINRIVKWIKAARSGNIDELPKTPPAKFLGPLHKEIFKIAKAMHDAKASAEEEAMLRAQNMDAWTPERLRIEMGSLLRGKKLVVVSNREPYMHTHEGKEIKVIVPASGLITAMEPILKACGGLWVASGTGDADRETVDKEGKIAVPPEDPKYVLKRLWLSKEEEDHFYYGFSNEGLWPLCHIAHTRPVFRVVDWNYYKKVNMDYAEAVLKEIEKEDQPLVLIQDYHFALLPAMIKQKRPDARVAIFWHIPWPNPESFGICPWQKNILQGMLGADLIGFHTQYHCNHFLETVNNGLESRVTWDNFTVTIGGHCTHVKPFPISIDFMLKDTAPISVQASASRILDEHGITAELMGVGVDRLDYTKGIVEKFQAIERLFEIYPQYIGKFTFVQIGAPSRTLLKTYADMVSQTEAEASRINWKFKTRTWRPILLLKRHHSHEEITPYYEAANVCIVNSLHDGMNLVAKEFVASRRDHRGSLILSQFAGASQDMHGAIITNPYDIDGTAECIRLALEMPSAEQEQRMQLLRQRVANNNIFYWAANLLRTMCSIHTLN